MSTLEILLIFLSLLFLIIIIVLSVLYSKEKKTSQTCPVCKKCSTFETCYKSGYRPSIPQIFIDNIKSELNNSRYPKLNEEDIKKIINFRYNNPNLPKCNENSTDLYKDCNLEFFSWICGEPTRKDDIYHCNNMSNLLEKDDFQIKKILNEASDNFVSREEPIPCSSIYPNNETRGTFSTAYKNSVVNDNTRRNIQNNLNSCTWNKNEDGSLKKDFTKL